MVWALEVDTNLLNQHCKPVDWLADWLTDWLRHLGTRALKVLEEQVSTPALRALAYLGHSGTWEPEVLGHSKGTWALEHSRHLGTRALKGHLGTQALGHLGNGGIQGILFSRLNSINNTINWNNIKSNLWRQSNKKVLKLTEWHVVPQFQSSLIC